MVANLGMPAMASSAWAQEDSARRELSRAVELHQSGHYAEAIAAIAFDNRSGPVRDLRRCDWRDSRDRLG